MSSTGASREAARRARLLSACLRVSLAAASSLGMLTVAAPAGAASVLTARHRPEPTTTGPGATTTSTGLPPMPAPTSPPAVAEDTCVRGAWEPSVEGRPGTFSAGGYAAYFWHDADGGWALRVTNGLDRAKTVFSGSLISPSGQFTNVSPMGTGSNDIVYQPNKHVVYFRFVNFGQVDGLNFGTLCSKGFTVTIKHGPPLASLAPSTIYLGSGSVGAGSNPFRVQRERFGEAKG